MMLRLGDRLWCWIVSLWSNHDGHEWVNEEEDILARVTTSRCTVCGETDTVWKRLP